MNYSVDVASIQTKSLIFVFAFGFFSNLFVITWPVRMAKDTSRLPADIYAISVFRFEDLIKYQILTKSIYCNYSSY